MVKRFLAFLHRKKRARLDVDGMFRYTWIEESFTTPVPFANQRPTPKSREFIGGTLRAPHVVALRLFLLILILIITSRLLILQGVHGAEYFAKAENNRIRIYPIASERGIIYDRNQTPLVSNESSFSLVLVPQDVPRDPQKRNKLLEEVAALADIPQKQIEDQLNIYKNYSYEAIIVAEGLPYETALAFAVQSTDLPGIRIQQGTGRNYRYIIDSAATSTPQSLSHVLGYTGKLSQEELSAKYDLGYLPTDNIGKIGVERSYEDFLRGNYGRKKVEVDAAGRERIVLAVEPPTPGRHVVLGIDAQLQKHLEETLSKTLKANNKQRAAAVAIDPRDGTILAMVSLPSYDNNDFVGGIHVDKYSALANNPDQPLFGRATAGTYPSGSTLKPLVAAAALQEEVITPATSFRSAGGLQVNQWFFPDWKAGGHGLTNVVKALAESVNTFFFIIGGGYENIDGMGVDVITKYLRTFGLAERLGIDLPAEASGFLPSRSWKEEVKNERWYIGDTYNLSIGQGDVLVTPLQMAAATAAVANGGTVYRPHVVERVIDPTTQEVQPIEPQIISKVPIDQQHLQTVRAGMRACSLRGSCRSLNTLSLETAGKTGTAQWSSKHEPHAWFVGFAPYKNPQIAIAVVVEEGEEGSRVALPVAKELFRYWANNTKL